MRSVTIVIADSLALDRLAAAIRSRFPVVKRVSSVAELGGPDNPAGRELWIPLHGEVVWIRETTPDELGLEPTEWDRVRSDLAADLVTAIDVGYTNGVLRDSVVSALREGLDGVRLLVLDDDST